MLLKRRRLVRSRSFNDETQNVSCADLRLRLYIAQQLCINLKTALALLHQYLSMKTLFLLPALLLLAGASQAQRPERPAGPPRPAWSVGVLGSYGHYKFNPMERQFGQYLFHIYGIESLDASRIGVFARKPLGRATGAWYVQAELDRSVRNAFAQFENLAPEPTPQDFMIMAAVPTIRRYDLTMLLGVRPLRSPLRLLAGPVVSYGSRRQLLRDNDWSNSAQNSPYRRIFGAFYNGFHRATLGYQLGAGVEFWRVSLDFRREFNLTPVVGKVRYEGQSYRTGVTGKFWMATLGVRVWDKKPAKEPAQL